MNIIIDHLEYLLCRHDCVIVPGIGALIVRYRPARFDSRNPLVILPPTRELAFNGALIDSDGILENSVARRNGISFEAAGRMVKEEAECLLQQLKTFGSLILGRLGELAYTEYDTILFTPSDVSGWDFRFYGLRPLYLKNADSVVCSKADVSASGGLVSKTQDAKSQSPVVSPWAANDYIEEEETARGRSRLTRSIVGVAASLAVIVTLALFIINPIKLANEPVKASMAPVETVVPADDDAMVPTEENQDVDVPEEDQIAGTCNEVKPAVSLRFSSTDPFCVIVASFPEDAQAARYISGNPGRQLGVLQQDGKYRVYAATGGTYEEASAQKSIVGSDDAWICRR